MSALAANANNLTTLKNFIPLEKIGTGSFSSVYKVRRVDDDKIYALKKVKIMSLKQRQKQNALNQIQILASLNSESLVCYKEAFFDQKLSLLCIVMEFAEQGDLNKAIEAQKKKRTPFDQQQIWKAIYDVLRGLQVLHAHSIMHRDIKSANIFISGGTYKLGDLNVAKINDSNCQLAFTQTGTPNYASPQVWRDQPYDNKSDIWSLGCVIYEMCTFKAPFKGSNLDELYKSVQKGYYQPISKGYSRDLATFIDICLKKNPFERLSTTDFLQIDGLVMRNVQGVSKGQQSTSSEVKSSKLIRKISLPSNIKDLKHYLPQAKYDSKTQSSVEQITKDNQNVEQPLVYNLDKKGIIKSPSMPKRLSIKYTECSKIKDSQISKEMQNGQKSKGLVREMALLKDLSRKYSVPEAYSQRNIVIKTEQKQVSKEHQQQIKRPINLLGLNDNRNEKSCRGISNGSQKDLRTILYQKGKALQQKLLRNVRSEKSIHEKTDKKIGLIQKQTYIKNPSLLIQFNPEAQEHNANYIAPVNHCSDRKNLKLKKISSTPYICEHNARLKLALNRVKNVSIEQKRLVGKRYLMIAS